MKMLKVIQIVILIVLISGCGVDTFQPTDEPSIDFTILPEVKSEDEFSIEEYDMGSLVEDSNKYLVFSIGIDKASMIIFDVNSFKIMDIDLLTYKILKTKEYDVGSLYQIVHIDTNGAFALVENSNDMKDLIYISFNEDSREVLRQNEETMPIVRKLKDNYFYTSINAIKEDEFCMSIHKYNPYEGINNKLQEYSFMDYDGSIEGDMITTLGALDINHEKYNPNYIYFQTVELENTDSSNGEEFTLVEFNHVLGEIEEQWEINEPIYTMWGYNMGEPTLIYSEYTDSKPRKEIGKIIDVERDVGWIFPGIETGKEITEVYSVSSEAETILLNNNFMIRKYNGMDDTYSMLTVEYPLGIGNLMIYETDNYYNFAYEKYTEEGKKLIYHRIKHHYSDTDDFDKGEFKFAYDCSYISKFHEDDNIMYYLETRENYMGRIQSVEATIWKKDKLNNSFKKEEELSYKYVDLLEEQDFKIKLDGVVRDYSNNGLPQ